MRLNDWYKCQNLIKFTTCETRSERKVKSMAEEKSAPVEKFRAGGVSATIWENNSSKDGKDFVYFTVSVERNYKDGEVWKKTSSMRLNDLPKVALVSQKAYEYLVLKEAE